MMDKNIRVLVVDDASTMRRMVTWVLKNLGYKNVNTAENGEDALKKLKEELFQLVICDWNMPVMSGLDLLKAVRGENSYKSVPFVMLTAEARKENIMAAIQAGVTDYIRKPFTEEVLAKKLEEILSR